MIHMANMNGLHEGLHVSFDSLCGDNSEHWNTINTYLVNCESCREMMARLVDAIEKHDGCVTCARLYGKCDEARKHVDNSHTAEECEWTE